MAGVAFAIVGDGERYILSIRYILSRSTVLYGWSCFCNCWGWRTSYPPTQHVEVVMTSHSAGQRKDDVCFYCCRKKSVILIHRFKLSQVNVKSSSFNQHSIAKMNHDVIKNVICNTKNNRTHIKPHPMFLDETLLQTKTSYVHEITLKRVTTGGAHLRGLAPELHSSEET